MKQKTQHTPHANSYIWTSVINCHSCTADVVVLSAPGQPVFCSGMQHFRQLCHWLYHRQRRSQKPDALITGTVLSECTHVHMHVHTNASLVISQVRCTRREWANCVRVASGDCAVCVSTQIVAGSKRLWNAGESFWFLLNLPWFHFSSQVSLALQTTQQSANQPGSEA